MTSTNMHSFGPLPRQIAKKTLRGVNFICNAPQAQAVSLVGDFNGWDPAAHPMRQMPDRAWFLKVELNHGHHRYAFLVDGTLTLDPARKELSATTRASASPWCRSVSERPARSACRMNTLPAKPEKDGQLVQPRMFALGSRETGFEDV